jgi:chorismate mutase
MNHRREYSKVSAMSNESFPSELLEARKLIDQIDEEVVRLLARRFELTHRVGQLKASNRLEAIDPERDARKLEAIRAQCLAQNLNPQLVGDLFAQIMAEVVRNHRRLRDQA